MNINFHFIINVRSTCKKFQQGLILSLKLVNSVLVWWISFQDQNLGQGVKGSPINTHFY